MKNPSNEQLEFVRDIEDAVTDLVQRNVKVTKIYQVTEQAGREVHDLGNFVNRFKINGNHDLLARIAEAYLKVGLAPTCVVKALEALSAEKIGKAPESDFHLSPSMPQDYLAPKPHKAKIEVLDGTGEDEVSSLSKVLRILDKLPAPAARRIADQAYRWVGMGL